MYSPVIIFKENGNTYPMLIISILFIIYLLAVNFYAFMLVKNLKDKDDTDDFKGDDSKLALAGLLGGAIAIYVCMFIYKYKQTNVLLMILMPLLGVLHIFLCIVLLRYGIVYMRI